MSVFRLNSEIKRDACESSVGGYPIRHLWTQREDNKSLNLPLTNTVNERIIILTVA